MLDRRRCGAARPVRREKRLEIRRGTTPDRDDQQICIAEPYLLKCAVLPESTRHLRKGKIDAGEGDSAQGQATFDPLDPITPREPSVRPRNLVQDQQGWELESSKIDEAVDDR